MRWLICLSNANALENFEAYIEARIEHHLKILEDNRLDFQQLRFQQGCIGTLRQTLLDAADFIKESKSNGYTGKNTTRPE
jgi:hypothetical protein